MASGVQFNRHLKFKAWVKAQVKDKVKDAYTLNYSKNCTGTPSGVRTVRAAKCRDSGAIRADFYNNSPLGQFADSAC